ncbi:FAD-dependent oxidoreductase [Acidovorax sp. NPDC077693]|uniref:FAD-dependent oxidoreductase n=1 Tax=unclassified Acidovorax TaxID=2684926 RepID=UPI0037CB346F
MTTATPTASPDAPPSTCDLLIVGAGPAGLAAALAAAPSGARIVLLDDNPAPGGQIWRDGPGVTLPPAARQQRKALERHAHVQLRCGTRVVGLAEQTARSAGLHALWLEDAQGGWVQHARQIILCTGARELLLPFPGWTLPGVTGAGGLQALIKGGLPVAGQRIVVAGSGPLLLAAAHTARQAGAQVVTVAEQAPWTALARFGASLARWPGKAVQAAALLPAVYRAGSHVVRAHGAHSPHGAVQSVTLHQGGQEREIACDRLACGFGLVPNTELGQMLGGRVGKRQGLAVDADQRLLRGGAAHGPGEPHPADAVPGLLAAGECTGFGGSERSRAEGAIAGHIAVGDIAAARALHAERARWHAFADALHRHFALQPALRRLAEPDTLVCRCEDVRYADLAQRSGWIDAKLHTRCGMGACQGRICGAATHHLLGWTPAPPRHLLAPVRIGTLAAVAAAAASSSRADEVPRHTG